MARRRVLLVGWDAADWKVIHPLIEAGHMPNLAALIDRGVMGSLATLQPMLSPMLWTSIATGKRPYQHGIHGFSEVAPETGDIRPVSSRSRTTKALWNVLHQAGKACHVVGWWPSHPVEPIRGVMVSNHFQLAPADRDTRWPLPHGTVHPPDLADELARLRIHPHEIEGDMLRSFVPRAPEVDQAKDRRLHMLAKVVAETLTVHAAATHALTARPDWDFAGIYYDSIDHFSHGFMRYHPPRLDWVTEHDFELYRGVIGGAYVLHDTMLGVLMAHAGDDVTVILVSDHGFHPDHLRPRVLPNEPAGPAAEHRPFGIFVAAGPGIRRDELVHGATLLDIAPTVLSLFDLPVGRDMDGRPLMTIYEDQPAVRFVESWDDVPGDAALLDRSTEGGSENSAAVLKQLADLGYIDTLPDDRQQAIDETVREERWNLCRALADGGRLEEAAAIAADLWDRWPYEGRFGVALLHWLLDLERVVDARAAFERLCSSKQSGSEAAARELAAKMRALRESQGLPEVPPDELAVGLDMQALPETQRYALQRLRARASTNRQTFAYLEGLLLAGERRYPEALAAFERAEQVQNAQRPSLLQRRGDVLLKMRRPSAAAAAYAAALEADPVNPEARFGLARAALASGDPSRAKTEALAALAGRQVFPRAHVVAGVANWQCGDMAAAERHLREAVAQYPDYPAAHRLLAIFLARVKREPAAAWDHRVRAADARQSLQRRRSQAIRPPRRAEAADRGQTPPWDTSPRGDTAFHSARCVVVVSGLPRSGTSMMMQMLQAGGVPVLADDKRLADENNPRGYLEFEPAKRLVQDNSWLTTATGKAVKIVVPLVQQLPRSADAPPFLVVMMRRPINEVVTSQRAMLARDGRSGASLPDETLAAILERQLTASRTMLAHLETQGRSRTLDLAYEDVLADPRSAAERLRSFLQLPAFDVAAAAASVDGRLHRVRHPVEDECGTAANHS